jgi:DNA-binding NarL/FixJ family response regulator
VIDVAAARALFRAQQESLQRPLTDQELKIVRLAAAGCTNREIGKRLYLSPHTVHAHLVHIFRKINVTSRNAAARWVAEHKLLPGILFGLLKLADLLDALSDYFDSSTG